MGHTHPESPSDILNNWNDIQSLQLSSFETNNNASWICDATTLQVFAVNKAALALYGFTGEEWLTLSLLHLFSPADRIAISNNPGILSAAGIWLHTTRYGAVFHIRSNCYYTLYNGRKAAVVTAIHMGAGGPHHELSKELIAQKQQLTDILSSIDELVWSRRADDNTLVYINDACKAVYGYTKEDMTGTSGKLEHIHPDDLAPMQREIEKTRITGRGEMEYRVYHKDGTLHHLYGHGVLKKGLNGAPDLINGVSMDITKLRETEQRLKEMNREMEHIFESINDSFIALDQDFNFTYINKEAAKTYSIRREELLHKNIWQVFPKGKSLKFYPELHRAMKEQVSVHFEEFSPSANLWVSINAYPTKNGLAVYFSDVTEQHSLQDQLINEGRKLKAIINNTRDIIWSMDRNLQIICANQAYYDRIAYMTGEKAYETVTIGDFSKERVDRWTAYFERAFNGETYYVVEQEVFKGETVFEEISFNPIHDKDGYIFGVSCFSRNITEQYRQLERIQQQNEKLSEISWLQSHQVRGPVATILGLVPLFNYENPADKANLEILDMLRSTAEKLDQNIKEVVNMARVV